MHLEIKIHKECEPIKKEKRIKQNHKGWYVRVRLREISKTTMLLMCPQHGIKHKAAVNNSKYCVHTVIAAVWFIPFSGHINMLTNLHSRSKLSNISLIADRRKCCVQGMMGRLRVNTASFNWLLFTLTCYPIQSGHISTDVAR